MGRADLHTHTRASDGELTARELVDKALQKKLTTLSITDHDTIAGYLDVKEYASQAGLELISGVEISTIWNDREIHMLAYGFAPGNDSLRALLLRQKRARKNRMKAIVSELNKKGIAIEYDEVMAEAGSGNIGRPHAASVLISKGYVASVPEAFIRYLSNTHLEGITTEYAEISEVVAIIKEAGGITSIAHPGPYLTLSEVEQLVKYGIDGIECIHPSHNFNVQRLFTRFAGTHNLLITGGSDFHGSPKSEYDPYFGIVTLGTQHVEAIKRSCHNRKRMLKSV